MFSELSKGLTKTLKHIKGQGRLSEANIEEQIREIRRSLLQADVALPVVKTFLDTIKEKALGLEVSTHLNPGQMFTKIVHDALINILGDETVELNLSAKPPVVILMAGLQGSGKTTTSAKLASYIKTRLKKSVFLTSTDIYRPAALEQLMTLAKSIDVNCYIRQNDESPLSIVKNAMSQASKEFADVIIIDTAGRLHIDTEMMDEIKAIHKASNPTETLFVVDAMTGQDAANSSKAFNDALPLTGIILTKADGDARGGAALSIKHITGKPIKFIGLGEKIDAIERFHPDRLASSILGMGDILSIVEEIEHKVDKAKSEKLAKKIKKGKKFTLGDFKEQIEQINNMGGLDKIMSKLPSGMALPPGAAASVDNKHITHMVAIINSMTPQERSFPKVIKGSRKRRIAAGSGTDVPQINRLMKQFLQMQKMMGNLKGNKLKRMMGQFPGMQGPNI